MEDVRIAVIGAGMAGLACAHTLARSDVKVTVFERGRGLGGRLATRRQGDLAFDHGAQFITARNRSFVNYAQAAVRAGVLDTWRPRVMEDDRAWPTPIDDWWIGTPGMSALLRPLARNLDVVTGVAVHELLPGQRGWELQTDSGRQNEVFRAVAVAVPAPQAVSLLGPHGRAFRHIGDVRMGPCWTGMFAFDPPLDARPARLGRVQLAHGATVAPAAVLGRARLDELVARAPGVGRAGRGHAAAARVQ
jgi:predicted NAD/FAD-dependent oxidoreductase